MMEGKNDPPPQKKKKNTKNVTSKKTAKGAATAPITQARLQ